MAGESLIAGDDDRDAATRYNITFRFVHTSCVALRCGAASCVMRQKRRNMPHDAAPQRTASGVNEPVESY